MTVTHVGSNGDTSGALGSTSVSAAYPAGHVAAGRLAVLIANAKPDTTTWNDPAGWTPANSRAGGTGTTGVDVGPTIIKVWVRELDGTESGSVTITNTGGNSASACMSIYAKAAGTTWDWDTGVGSDNTHADHFNATTTGTVPFEAGDMAVAAFGLDTDTNSSLSAITVASTGTTFGAGTRRNSARGTTGNDVATWSCDAPANSGSGNAVVTYSHTGTVSVDACGPLVILRLHEVSTTTPVSATFSAPYETNLLVTLLVAENWEAGQGLEGSWEAAGPVAATWSDALDVGGICSATITIPWESAGVSATRAHSLDGFVTAAAMTNPVVQAALPVRTKAAIVSAHVIAASLQRSATNAVIVPAGVNEAILTTHSLRSG